MSPSSEDLTLEARVKLAAQFWRELDKILDRIKQGATPETGWAVFIMMQHAVQLMESARRYLAQLKGSELDNNEAALASALDAVEQYLIWERVVREMGAAAVEADEQGKDPSSAALKAYVQVLRVLPVVPIANLKAPHSRRREEAAATVAGWAATQISLAVNKRLARALKEEASLSNEDETPFDRLVKELPTAVFLVEPEQWLGKHKGLKGFVNIVASHIEGLGPPEKERARPATRQEANDQQDTVDTANFDDDGITPQKRSLHRQRGTARLLNGRDVGLVELREGGTLMDVEDAFSLEDHVLREEARHELHELIERAGLSARERQVLGLRCNDYTLQMIANSLGIDIGAVSSYWNRAQRKLRKAAGR